MSSQDRRYAESLGHDGIVSLVEADGGLRLGLSEGSDSVDLILTLDQARRVGIYMLDYAQERHKPEGNGMSMVYRPRLGWIAVNLVFLGLDAFLVGVAASRTFWMSMAFGLICTVCTVFIIILTLIECQVAWKTGHVPQASDRMKTIKGKA